MNEDFNAQNVAFIKKSRKKVFILDNDVATPGYVNVMIPYTDEEMKHVRMSDRMGSYIGGKEKEHSPKINGLRPRYVGHRAVMAKCNLSATRRATDSNPAI